MGQPSGGHAPLDYPMVLPGLLDQEASGNELVSSCSYIYGFL